MAIDLTGAKAATDTLLTLWGETITIQRLSLNYSTSPPTETWSSAGISTISMEIQPISGSMRRHDAGLLAAATHWGLADYDSGLLTNDRIIRAGDTNYYEVIRVDNLEDHLEVWMKYVAGAI